MKLKLFFLAMLLALPALAQTDHYVAQASTTALTIQQPTSGGRQITFGGGPGQAGATIYCASAQTATLTWNGTAATATAGTEKLIAGTFFGSGATVWTASNSSGGTTINLTPIAAGAAVNYDLSPFHLGNSQSANLTIATTGTCTITFYYSAI